MAGSLALVLCNLASAAGCCSLFSLCFQPPTPTFTHWMQETKAVGGCLTLILGILPQMPVGRRSGLTLLGLSAS